VLVIEDDPADQAQLAQALRRGGYTVEVAATGAQALARCTERRFDAVTLDLLLPDMSGLEVLREIRGGENRDVPVLVITVVAERGAVAGFAVHDILPKPLDEAAVLDALASANIANRHQTVLVVDDDPGSLKLMAATLAGLGYKARCERDSERALAAARDKTPAAIILDLLMPELDGFDFLDRLRSDPAGRTIPVIVWTELDLDADQRSRLRSSAQAVVAKGHGGSAAVIAELEAFLPPEAARQKRSNEAAEA
jgi:CheY-like chemotaxis protein